MTLSAQARGVYAIAPTPFTPAGEVDHESLARLCRFYQRAGVTGVTVLGQLGEAPKLDAAESLAIVRAVVRDLPVPVVVGVTAPGFAAMRALTHEVMGAGAAGVMIVVKVGSARSCSTSRPSRSAAGRPCRSTNRCR